MTPAEAARIMNTARKHNEAVTDLAIELINMVAETFTNELMAQEIRNDQLAGCLEMTKAENEQLKAKVAEKVQKEPLKVESKENKPRRGRPPKKKTDAEAIHELAKDIFSE